MQRQAMPQATDDLWPLAGEATEYAHSSWRVETGTKFGERQPLQTGQACHQQSMWRASTASQAHSGGPEILHNVACRTSVQHLCKVGLSARRVHLQHHSGRRDGGGLLRHGLHTRGVAAAGVGWTLQANSISFTGMQLRRL